MHFDNDVLEETPVRRVALQRAGLLFAGLAAVFALIMAPIYYSERRSGDEVVKARQAALVESVGDVLLAELGKAVSDALFLSRLSRMELLLQQESRQRRHALAQEFLSFLLSKRSYDQARFLDAEGREVVRVNYNDGQPLVVPPAELQDKSEHEYFREARSLRQGQVWLSPLNLNREHGRVVRPAKPTIRLATPVYDLQERLRGVLVINYLGRRLLAYAERPGAGSHLMVVDQEGYWLRQGRQEEAGAWGRDLGTGRSFAAEFPAQWRHIREAEAGQLLAADGLYSFATLRPAEAVRRLVPEAPLQGEGSAQQGWKIIAFVPLAQLRQAAHTLRDWLLSLYGVLLVLFAAVATWYGVSTARSLGMEEELRRAAIRDGLTGHYNRRFGLGLAEHTLREAQRREQSVAVGILDLNDLKGVNDTQGHGAGDELLQTVAHAMRHHMREVDIVCRMGGDEFALVLPEADCDEARMVAERIREQARRAAGDRFAPWGVDFAFGCAAFDPQAPRDLDELLEAADERMYEDKRRRKAARQAPVPGGRTA